MGIIRSGHWGGTLTVHLPYEHVLLTGICGFHSHFCTSTPGGSIQTHFSSFQVGFVLTSGYASFSVSREHRCCTVPRVSAFDNLCSTEIAWMDVCDPVSRADFIPWSIGEGPSLSLDQRHVMQCRVFEYLWEGVRLLNETVERHQVGLWILFCCCVRFATR